ncbi:MAG: terpene cyclase/mutase family protein [Planctomycetota bacterium]|nr:terpene cyclase/mutase family protein [Planctomycetota bacterium]
MLCWTGGVLAVLALAGYLSLPYLMPHHSAPREAMREIAPSDDKALDAIRRGFEYLRVHQETNGHFSTGLLDPKPGFTALVVDALARLPVDLRPEDKLMLEKAAQAIVSCQRENGSICTPGLGVEVYTTAVSMMALKALNDPRFDEAIKRAQAYMVKAQRGESAGDLNSGGVGYNPGSRPDGSVSAMWVEAMKETGVDENSEAFENAKKFFTRLQNNPETNTAPPPEGAALSNDGGFIYRPGESKPPDEINREGKRVPQSYGLMSYAGLKSFLYMNVSKDDDRVKSAWRWVQQNYTLEENRNIGSDGLYYYYMTMAKALAAYGEPAIETPDGKQHAWARELTEKVLSLQRRDGSWQNTVSPKWMENDSVLVSAYALRTLAICRKFLSEHPVRAAPDEVKPEAKTE